MDRQQAAALDRYLTASPPEPEELPLPGEDGYPTCGGCAAFLKREADPELTTFGQLDEECDGEGHGDGDFTLCGAKAGHDAHVITVHAWAILHRICARCGKDNEEVDA